jgi:hypothetical protein
MHSEFHVQATNGHDSDAPYPRDSCVIFEPHQAWPSEDKTNAHRQHKKHGVELPAIVDATNPDTPCISPDGIIFSYYAYKMLGRL